MRKFKNIIFDFDGVLVESNEIRINGFKELFAEFPNEATTRLIEFCRKNGGMPRYQKIRHFFNDILQKPIADNQVNDYAIKYSKLVYQSVVGAPYVDGATDFLEKFKEEYRFAIVSGSDQNELRRICKERKIEPYFNEILGSPTDKTENIDNLLQSMNWLNQECIYIGDSYNDYKAASNQGIFFLGRNSNLFDWSDIQIDHIKDISELEEYLLCLASTTT